MKLAQRLGAIVALGVLMLPRVFIASEGAHLLVVLIGSPSVAVSIYVILGIATVLTFFRTNLGNKIALHGMIFVVSAALDYCVATRLAGLVGEIDLPGIGRFSGDPLVFAIMAVFFIFLGLEEALTLIVRSMAKDQRRRPAPHE